VITLALGIPLYNRMMVSSLNQSLAHVRGIKVDALEYIFVILLTIITVACVKIIGAILVEALLLIPAAAARNISRNLKSFVWMTVLISTLSCIGGILIPMQWDLPLPSGGAIVLVAAIFFILTTSLKGILPVFREARM